MVAPDERLPWPHTAAMGVQHVIAMFGATVLAPILMGFDPNVAILMSGIGTLIFFVVTGGQVPSYLGSSFAFIGVVIAATGYGGQGPNANLGVALGGIVACGVLYTLIGVLVRATNERHRRSTPMIEGLEVEEVEQRRRGALDRAADAAGRHRRGGRGDRPQPGERCRSRTWRRPASTPGCRRVTFVSVGLVAVYTRGMVQRLLILVGLIVAAIVYAVLTNGLGLGKPIDLAAVGAAPRGSACRAYRAGVQARTRCC